MIKKVYDDDVDAPPVIRSLLMLKGRFTIALLLATIAAYWMIVTHALDDGSGVFSVVAGIVGLVVLTVFTAVQVLVTGAVLSEHEWSW